VFWHGDIVTGKLKYNPALFSTDMARHLANDYLGLLEMAVAHAWPRTMREPRGASEPARPKEAQVSDTKGTALITGGSRGIGRSVAVALARDGYDIGFCYRNADSEAAKTAQLIEAEGRRVYSEAVDVADHDSVRDFVSATQEALGPPTAAVACAGVTRDRSLALMRPDEWSTVLRTNLDGAFHLAHGVIKPMMRNRSGSIVLMSSVSGLSGNRGQANYAASKSGMHGLALSLSKEVGPYGVRVNVVAPGLIETDMTSALPATVREAVTERIPLGRFGAPHHVAEAVCFLCSQRASYITGSILRVDGGLAL
jgi:3-oxoacyl-[acyl-carrier protein] reductase